MEILMNSSIGLCDSAVQIMSYLDFKDLKSSRLVCKTWFFFLEKQIKKLWWPYLEEHFTKLQDHTLSAFQWLPELLLQSDFDQKVRLILSAIPVVKFEAENKDNFLESPEIETYLLHTLWKSWREKIKFTKTLMALEMFDETKLCLKDFFDILPWVIGKRSFSLSI